MSGRIEITTHRSVLALANGKSFSILFSSGEKRKAILSLKRQKPHWSRKLTNIFIFSNLLFLLLKDHIDKLSMVIIDPEYPGHEPVIKNRVMTLCRQHGREIDKDQIVFRRVGKKSPAHELAIKVFRGKADPDRQIKAQEVLKLFK